MCFYRTALPVDLDNQNMIVQKALILRLFRRYSDLIQIDNFVKNNFFKNQFFFVPRHLRLVKIAQISQESEKLDIQF